MAIYALDVIQLLLMVLEIMSNFPDSTVKMNAYTDSFTTGRTIKGLKHCWDVLCKLGPKLGYYPVVTKWLIINEDLKVKADKR